MAFSNYIFPDYPLKHGISKRIIDPVSVITNGTYEYRIKKARWERYRWTISPQTMTDEQKETIRNFLVRRDHGLDSFRFVDPDYKTLDDAIMEHNSGTYWNLALPHATYVPGNHPIFNPIINQLTVTVNGTPGTINSSSILNGVPVIEVLGTTGNEMVRVSGNLYFTVRLNSPFNSALIAMCSDDSPRGHSVDAIELIEVYGEY